MRVIAIDGPAGSGKSTVARALASRLGLDYLDTGAMYRGVTFAVLRRQMDPDEEEPVAAVARDLELEVVDAQVTVDGVDASLEIRGPEVTAVVSIVSAHGPGRTHLVSRQRTWASSDTTTPSESAARRSTCSHDSPHVVSRSAIFR